MTDQEENLAHFLRDDGATRPDPKLVFTNDLSTGLMVHLESALKISLKMFEEHLQSSDWQDGIDLAPDVEPWFRGDTKKDYISIK